MSRDLIHLSRGQLHKLAELIHLQEVQKLQELKFNSYAEQQKYLNDAKDARDKVYHILDSTQEMLTQTEAEKDATKQKIAEDVYEYCTIAIDIPLRFIRSYKTRLTYLAKLQEHSNELIQQLKSLDTATQLEGAEKLSRQASHYKEFMLEKAKQFQNFIPNKFSEWLKETGIKFEDLVESHVLKLNLLGPFKNLENRDKLKVYVSILEEAGQGSSAVTFSFGALGTVGVAFLVFTVGAMVWDIYTAENKLKAAVKDSVELLIALDPLAIGEVVESAVEAGFLAADLEIASCAVAVIGSVTGFGIVVLIGEAAGALIDLIFTSGTSKVQITDGLTACRLSPMPDGVQLARLVKHNYPDL